jgi:rhamnosyltransferase
MSLSRRYHVCAVVVTYNPDLDRLMRVLDSLAPQTSSIVVVDNGSRNNAQLHLMALEREDIDVVDLAENLGIGAALNRGVTRALSGAPDWILTMDQDTLVDEGAIDEILTSYEALPAKYREEVGVVAMRAHTQPSGIWLTRYADRLLTGSTVGQFIERKGVITSGNLVRATVASRIKYSETLFIDQVDFDFCFAVRADGWRVIQQNRFSMDHILGERYHDIDKDHPYENAQRVYYIVRNSTVFVLRRRLLVRFYFVQLVVFCGAFVSMNGVRSLPLCCRVLLRGVVDALTRRMGRREYPFLSRGRR